jgi:transketolase N-terminal domain/subunit
VYCDEKFVIMYAQKGDNLNIMENKELALHAKNIRRNIVKEVYSAQSGHPGGSLGATDILTELYFEAMERLMRKRRRY